MTSNGAIRSNHSYDRTAWGDDTDVAAKLKGLAETMRWAASAPAVSIVHVRPDGRHAVLVNTGYEDRLLTYLVSDEFVRGCVGFARVRANPNAPQDWDCVPGFRDSLSAQRVFMPAGFRNGMSMLLVDHADRPAGVVHMASDTSVLDPRAHILFGGLRSALADLVEALGERTRAGLSSRELDVVRLVHEGLSNSEIARRLFLSERTVAKHVENILRKLQLVNRTQIAVTAERWRLSG